MQSYYLLIKLHIDPSKLLVNSETIQIEHYKKYQMLKIGN